MEDDRTTALESQLGQAKQIAEEADKKYEEVRDLRNQQSLAMYRVTHQVGPNLLTLH